MKRLVIVFFVLLNSWLTLVSAQADPSWFLGKWQAQRDGKTYVLVNNKDGTYTFSEGDYQETGIWQLDSNGLTQNWNDPTTGEAKSATYSLEKLSDTAFKQSGGNLEAGFVFSFTKLTDDTPAPPTAQAPPAAIDPTVTKDWLLGDWLGRVNSTVQYWTNREDGTYTIKTINLRGETLSTEDGTWSLENNLLTQTWSDADSGATKTSSYTLERTAEDALRFMGGNLGFYSTLYKRLITMESVTPVNSWLVGQWSGTGTDFRTYTWTLFSDSTYQLNIDDKINGNNGSDAGNWTLENDQLAFTGATPTTYRIGYRNDYSITLYISEDDTGLFLQKSNGEPYDPFKPFQFAGQYMQANETVTLTYDGTNYGGTWLVRDQVFPITSAQTKGDTITVHYTKPAGDTSMTLRLDNNGLRQQGDVVANDFYAKVSETQLSVLSDLADNFWFLTKTFNRDDPLMLLSDGHYWQRHYYDEGSSYTEGLYTLQDNQLTLDPVCGGPASYTISQVQNHLLLSSKDIAGDSVAEDIVTSTYMAAPDTSVAYRLEQYQIDNEVRQQANLEWEEKIPLADIDMNMGRAPAGGEVSLDPNPDNRFEGATVFAESEIYPYTSDYFYVFEMNGAFIMTSQVELALEEMSAGPARDIDYSRGEFHDKFTSYFFPNGRMLSYFENYSGADITGNTPKPVLTYDWGRYKVEDNVINIETDAGEQLSYELLYGRRKIRSGDECYDNLEFATQ
jgi:hypothetical protein